MLPEEPEELVPVAEPTAIPEIPPATSDESFWGFTDLALVLGLIFAFSVVVIVGLGLLALAVPRIRLDPMAYAIPVQLVFYALVYLSFRVVFGLRYHRPVFRSLGWRNPHMNLLLAAFGGFLLALLLSVLGSALKTPKIPTPFDQLTKTPMSFVAFGVLAVFLAPLFEELFFRGFIQPLLSKKLGTVAGVLITAVLFGALHGFEYSWVWQYALFISIAGLVFGWLRARTNSIIPSMVMHGCFNAVSVAALAFGKDI